MQSVTEMGSRQGSLPEYPEGLALGKHYRYRTNLDLLDRSIDDSELVKEWAREMMKVGILMYEIQAKLEN